MTTTDLPWLPALLAEAPPPGQSRQRALHERLRGAILQGRLAAGARLPASRTLADALGVARNTVLFAYEQLAAEGYLHASRHGTRVAALPLATAPEADVALPGLSGRALAVLPPQAEPPDAGLLPLALGVPDVGAFPIRAWRASLDRAWRQASARQLGYAPPGGEPALRAALARYLSGVRGLAVSPAQVIVTAGTQNGLDLCARLLADAGDTVWVEDPGYVAARTAFALAGLRPHGIAVDDDGLAPGPDDWARHPPRLIFVTPSHQFPTGAVLSLPRRLALLEYAARQASYVLEDDYDGEYRHRGHPLAALRALDRDGRVLYVGSFSRIVFPALRLGYLVMPPALRPALQAARWLADRGSAAIDQRALASLIAGGQLERQLLRNARRLDEQRAVLLAALAEHLGEGIAISGGDAGMHLCVRLLDLPTAAEPALVAAAARLDVGVYGARDYYQAPPAHAQLLLGYAHLSPVDLKEAVARLARAVIEVRGG